MPHLFGDLVDATVLLYVLYSFSSRLSERIRGRGQLEAEYEIRLLYSGLPIYLQLFARFSRLDSPHLFIFRVFETFFLSSRHMSTEQFAHWAADDRGFLSTILATTVFKSVLQGFLIAATYRYYTRTCSQDGPRLKTFVGAVMVLEM